MSIVRDIKLVTFIIFFCSASLSAQTDQKQGRRLNSAQELGLIIVTNHETPHIDYEPVQQPKYWTNGMLNQIGFSQVSLTNWAEGGYGSLSMNGYVNMHANYKKGNLFWENRGEIAYGFIQSLTKNERFKKSEDKIILDSKWGYRAIDNLYFSALSNFRTQLTPSYKWVDETTKTMLSNILAPAYATLGLGVEYKPIKAISINFAPLTGKLVIVAPQELREKYGNRIDQTVRAELGAQLKTELKASISKNIKIETTLTLFSDYLDKIKNVKVYWDTKTDFIINKYFSTTLRSNLIYDDKIKIMGDDGIARPKVQFKEVFSLTFTYTIGNYQKPK